MKILNTHVALRIILSIFIVTFVLAGILLFVLFVGELDAMGQGDYTLWAAFYVTLLQVPQRIYQFFPMISLIGALLGLGLMANNNELTIMRAAGVSKLQIFATVIQAAFIWVIAMCLIGELFAPSLLQKASDYKAFKRSSGQVMRSAQSLWMRHQNDFIHIAHVVSPKRLDGIKQYHFNAQGKLRAVTSASHADKQNDQWLLSGVERTELDGNAVKATQRDRVIWDNVINEKLLQVANLEPEEMTLPTLKHFIALQKQNHIAVNQYEFAYWQRLLTPLSTCVMILLALPFIFGSARQMTMGTRLTLGVVVGFLFFIANRFLGPFGMLIDIHPATAALIPTVLFASIGLAVMLRTR